MSTPFTVFFTIFLKLLNNHRLAAGGEIDGPGGGLGAVEVAGSGAYTDLVEASVQYVRALGGALHPAIEGLLGRGAADVAADVLDVGAPLVVELLHQVPADVTVGEGVAPDHLPEWALAVLWSLGWTQRRGRSRLARSLLWRPSICFSAALIRMSSPVQDLTLLAASVLPGSTAEAPITAVCLMRSPPLRYGPSIRLSVRRSGGWTGVCERFVGGQGHVLDRGARRPLVGVAHDHDH